MLIAIFLTLASAIVTLSIERYLDGKQGHAVLMPELIYRYDSKGEWTVIWTLENRGPGVARNLQISYFGTNSSCGVVAVDLDDGETSINEDDWKYGSDCAGGVDLVDAQPARPSDVPGVFVTDISDEGKLFGLGIYSAVARELNPGEKVWIELNFRSSPDVDEKLLPMVKRLAKESSLSRSESRPFTESFSELSVSGIGVTVDDVEYSVRRLRG